MICLQPPTAQARPCQNDAHDPPSVRTQTDDASLDDARVVSTADLKAHWSHCF